MNTRYFIFTFFAFTLFLGACRKDNTVTETIVETPEPAVYIETQIEGRVFDQDGTAIEGAQVNLGSEQVLSDQNGWFRIAATTGSDRAAVSIHKDGFFSHYPTINPSAESVNRLEVKLRPRVLSYEFTATEGGSFSLSNGSGVQFAANAMVQANGQPYAGSVMVYSQYIDPTASDLQEIMPGNLQALDAEEELRALESYGMIRVELEDPSGNPLQISEPATLTVDVPASLEGNAPSTIPLWHFDEASGLWLEEGEATLQNGVYVGEVSHFSFWNCDIPIDFIYLDGGVSINGFETSAKVCVEQLSTGTIFCTLTDDKGNFEGWVPKDELLEITVQNNCNEAIYTEQVGPYSINTSLPTFVINAPTQEYVDISGSLVNCDNEPLTSGYILVQGNSNSPNSDVFHVQPDGTVEGNYLVCSSTEVSIRAFDSENLVISDPTTFPVAPSIDFGTMAACGTDLGLGMYITGSIFNEYYEATDPVAVAYSQTTGDPYTFTFDIVADYPSGQVIYQIAIINWTEDLNSPLFATSMQYTVVGDPEIQYEFTASEILFAAPDGATPGNLFTFDLIDATIAEQVSDITDFGNITLVGILGN